MKLTIPARARAVNTFPGGWTLYKKADDGYSFLWSAFRLMLPPDTPKRNGQARVFDLAWNPAECRFSRARDTLALLTQEPDLAAAVELYLGLQYGPQWLQSDDGGGYTREDIQAEKTRLEAARAARRASRRRPGGARPETL